MADRSEQRPANQLCDAIRALKIVEEMPGCDALSFAFGMAHGISLAVDFPEWALAFHLKEHPTAEEKANWRREHGEIVELTPMTMNHDPNPTGQ